MIRTAVFHTYWKGICGGCKSSCPLFLAIVGVTLSWWHMEDLGSIVRDSSSQHVHVNMSLVAVATPAMISWLAYREYYTVDCSSNNCDGGGGEGGCSRSEQPINKCNNTMRPPGCDERHTTTPDSTTTTKGMCTTRRYYRNTSSAWNDDGWDRLTNSQGRGLPDDILISICSYLHPRDVTSFATVNRSSLEVLDGRCFICDDDDDDDERNTVPQRGGGSGINWKCQREGRLELKLKLKHTRIRRTSNNLWKSLWYRDYGQVLLGWHIGREALWRSLQESNTTKNDSNNEATYENRSNNNDNNNNDNDTMLEQLSTLLAQKLDTLSDMKYFYFSFLETYMDYVLAGQNTPDSCFLGMHGHIFDFTNFADYHPGLAEPIRLECGKDATQYFEDLPHSSVARKIAQKLCVLVDRACLIHHHHPSSSSSLNNNHKNNNKNNGCDNGGGGNTTGSGGCGLYQPPTQYWSALNSNSRPPPRGDDASDVIFGLDRVIPTTSFTEKKRANSLCCMRDLFDREQQEKKVTAATMMANTGTLNRYLYKALFSPRRGGGDGGSNSSGSSSKDPLYLDMHVHGRIHVYYDPFDQRWKSWYTRLNCQPAYCELD